MRNDKVTFDLRDLYSRYGFSDGTLLNDFYEVTKLSESVVGSGELILVTVRWLLTKVDTGNPQWKIEYIHSSHNCVRICDEQAEAFEKWCHTDIPTQLVVDFESLAILYAEAASAKFHDAMETIYWINLQYENATDMAPEAKSVQIDCEYIKKLDNQISVLRRNIP